MQVRYSAQNRLTEWSYSSGRAYADPFNDVELDVVFTDSEGEERRVPTFWAGGNVWRVRYASPKVGTHRFRTDCSDEGNADLHGREGRVEITPYDGDNPLMKHGPLRVSENRRHLEHLDGKPFFWLGDTWWMGLCKRFKWPGDFMTLLADRVAKGFSVIQIVAGLYPDMHPFDERGENEAGFPWEKDYSRINPAYFDMADLRIDRLVGSGLVPCIVACWGYFLKWMGVETMKKHWRHLVARYGAYLVVWCLAGEATMPFYLSEEKDKDQQLLKKGWTDVARYVRAIDPYHHPFTIHPTGCGRDQVEDPALLDVEMLQTGHEDRRSIPNTVRLVEEARGGTPRMPVIDGEVCYEGIGGCCRDQVQRFMFWACMLSGAAGHTYGANGIWQVNTRESPYGPSPHGMSWGDTPWEEAHQLPGSAQLGLGKRLLERYEWWRFEPHPEWVEPHWTEDDYLLPYAAGIPGEVRVIFLPFFTPNAAVKQMESDVRYRAFLFNPVNGGEQDLGIITADQAGEWRMPFIYMPIFQDWLLVLEGQ